MSAGKGDAYRPVNLSVYRENYDKIFYKRNRKTVQTVHSERSFGNVPDQTEDHKNVLKELE